MAAKNGWSCPSTAEARNHARLAATAVCKMGHTPTPNRPNASSNRRRTAQNPPSGTTHVSILRFTTKHLLRVLSVPICALHTSDTNTTTLAVKGFRGVFEQFVIVLLLGCYLVVTFSRFDRCWGGCKGWNLGDAGSSPPRESRACRTLLRDLQRPGSRLAWCPGSHQLASRHHLYFASDVDPYLVSISGRLQVQE
jgi:hypothetical protein